MCAEESSHTISTASNGKAHGRANLLDKNYNNTNNYQNYFFSLDNSIREDIMFWR
jgi:hypothetical protein